MSVDRQDPFLVDHPLTRDRMDLLRRRIAEAKSGNGDLPPGMEAAFLLVRAKLDGFLSIPGTVLRAYPQSDQSAPALYARAAAEHRLTHDDDALALMNRLVAQQPANPWFRELRGQILFESGHPRDAIPDYREAVRLRPDQLRPAIEQLEIARRQDADDPDIWHLLGLYWGQFGDLGQANLALAEEAMLTGDVIAAKRFSRLAAESLPQGPLRLRALDIGNAMKRENRP